MTNSGHDALQKLVANDLGSSQQASNVNCFAGHMETGRKYGETWDWVVRRSYFCKPFSESAWKLLTFVSESRVIVRDSQTWTFASSLHRFQPITCENAWNFH